MRLFGEFGSFGALALGVGLEEVEVVLLEPAVGSKIRMMFGEGWKLRRPVVRVWIICESERGLEVWVVELSSWGIRGCRRSCPSGVPDHFGFLFSFHPF